MKCFAKTCVLLTLVFSVLLSVVSNADTISADPDCDGFSSALELLLNTDPNDSASHPTLADNQWKIMTCWPLANNAIESFGSGLDGTAENGAEFTGDALVLDGINDYMSFGNDQLFSFQDKFTISLWMMPVGKWGTGRIIGKYGNDAQRQYSVFIQGSDQFYIFLSGDGSNQSGHTILKASGKKIIKRDKWQHLAITCDLNNEERKVQAYLNGVNLSLCVVADSEMKEIFSGTSDLTLGAYDVQVQSNNGAKGKEKDKVQNAFRGEFSQLILGAEDLTDLEVKEVHLLGMDGDLLDYISMDYDSDGMPDWWERRYFGDIQPGAEGDEDDDGRTNLQEYEQNLDPTSSDTDKDGFDDSYDNQISRVNIAGDIEFTEGDEYVYPGPDWLLGVWKEGGEWHSWYVDPDSTEPAALIIELDRTKLIKDVVMEIEYLEIEGSTLYVALLDSDYNVLDDDLYGNIQADGVGDEMSSFPFGDERVVRKKFIVPLQDNPTASILKIYRGTGEILVLEVSLYEDSDGDGLDDQQEAQIGTSPYLSDSDGDGLLDGDEVFVYGTSPIDDDSLLDDDDDGVSNLDEILRGTGINDDQDTNIIIYANASTGSDAYNGYAEVWTSGIHGPKATIGAAIETAINGDTIEVAGGTYSELPATYDLTGRSLAVIPQGPVTIE